MPGRQYPEAGRGRPPGAGEEDWILLLPGGEHVSWKHALGPSQSPPPNNPYYHHHARVLECSHPLFTHIWPPAACRRWFPAGRLTTQLAGLLQST